MKTVRTAWNHWVAFLGLSSTWFQEEIIRTDDPLRGAKLASFVMYLVNNQVNIHVNYIFIAWKCKNYRTCISDRFSVWSAFIIVFHKQLLIVRQFAIFKVSLRRR